MLRNCAHMFHATQLHVLVLFVYCTDGVGVRGVRGRVGVVSCVVLAHMLDSTQLRTHVPRYATACARTVRILHGWGGGWGWAVLHCLGTQINVGCYATAHMFHGSVPRSVCSRSKSDRCFNLEWNSTCTATCSVSTTETGGSSSESCASNNEKKQTKTAKEVFFWGGGGGS